MFLMIFILCATNVELIKTECINETTGKITCNNPLNYKIENTFYGKGSVNHLYTSNYTIRNIVVPFDGYTESHTGENWLSHPPIFFNLLDLSNTTAPHNGQYVLIDKVPHKILNGTDATADRIAKVYFAGVDGIYIYNSETKSAEKYGTITRNWKTIDKVTAEDEIHVLSSDNKIYRVTEKGTFITRIEGIKYAKHFRLDLLGAIYFYGDDNVPQILKRGDTVPYKFEQLDFKITDEMNPFFTRPSLNYNFNGMVFIVDGVQYFLFNGTNVQVVPNVYRVNELTSYDGASFFYQFFAVNGGIYEQFLLKKKV